MTKSTELGQAPAGSAAPDPAQALIAQCRAFLSEARRDRARAPDANPVRALAYDLSRRLERKALSVDDIAAGAQHLSDAAFRNRAARLADYAGDEDIWSSLRETTGDDLTRLKALVSRPLAGVVFTAHPTFALSQSMRAALAAMADDPAAGEEVLRNGGAHGPDPQLTVFREHQEVQDAVERAQDALNDAHAQVLAGLQDRDPAGWRAVTPRLATVASWVGYDLDGRSDIAWTETLRFRLLEKARQLRRYAAAADAITPLVSRDDVAQAAVSRLRTMAEDAAQSAEEEAARFAGQLDTVERLAAAGNGLTAADPRRLTRIAPLLEPVQAALDMMEDGPAADALWLLRAEMAGFGLGTAEVHLRVNAAQVRNAARADFNIDTDGFGRMALNEVARQAGAVDAERVNFASVFLERATARRQIMLAAQIRKHVDADSPIRFLIAETESPVTILAAVYLARRYGVADGLDISPLFETPSALEGGGRLMEQLFDEPQYLDYVQARGRIAIQIGFSDSGRYMGQLPAGFAAERLQILVARALARREIRNLDVIVFNTHGESMGRGAHPGGMAARLHWLLTPWTVARFRKERISLVHETSFQGGDGFLHFATPARAKRSLDAIIATRVRLGFPVPKDRFYTDLNFSWDVYRALKAWQEDLSADPDHGAVLAGMGPHLLFKTGSRPVKRVQMGPAMGGSPRGLRAIPHNAILQQLAAPANVACGIGRARGPDLERFVEWAGQSPRAIAALEIAATARGLTSENVLRAYAGLFDPTFWSARAFGGDEPEMRAPAGLLSARLRSQRRATAFARLANRVAGHVAHLDDVAERVPALQAARDRCDRRRDDIELLQALRLALLMHAFLLVARTPTFSDRFDVKRNDLVDMTLDLRLDETAELLDQIFPEGGDGAAVMAALEEPADNPGDRVRGYPELQADIVRPVKRIARIMREMGVGLAHAYDAYG